MRATQMIKDTTKQPLRCLVAGVLLFIASGSALAQDAVSLKDIVFSKLSGDDVQINLVTDGNVGEPGSFSTNSPARIALDFFGMKKNLATNIVKIGAGQVDSVVAVETPDRTRVIINLFDTARYEVIEADNGYAITVFNTNIDESQVTAPKPFASRPDIVQDNKITNIDFRRSEAGGGTLIVDMSDDGATVDTRETDGNIIVDLLGVGIPPELERRLDVVDFATPVQSVDSFQNSDNVRLVVVPTGKYQHLSFQAGNRFTLVVDPVVITPKEQAESEDAALGFTGERLSINFQKIDVRSALAVIADFTGINFVTSDSVEGEITLNLKDVPWDQALDVIMRSKGLAKRQTGNVIWVAPSREIATFEEQELRANAVRQEFAPLSSEIIQINYARAEDISEVVRSVRVLGGAGGAAPATAATLGGLGAGAGNGGQTDESSLLTARGSVTVDERTNSLLVQDVASKIVELRKVIARLDKPIRQVLIETRIVQATDSFSRELGARLGFQRVTENAQFPGANGSNIGDFVGSGTTEGLNTIQNSRIDDEPGLIFDSSRGAPGGLAVDLGAEAIAGSNAASYAFDIFRTGNGFAHLITLELSALEADGNGKIVASPRLVTANQREAVISQGNEVFIPVPGGGLGAGSLERVEAELRLVVTPQITPDDRVIMDVAINQDELISATPGVTTLGTTEIQTQILADNGETIVIGGIYQETINEATTKVPVLGDLPVLGNLFRRRSKEQSRTELLIFLTPKIISPKLNLG